VSFANSVGLPFSLHKGTEKTEVILPINLSMKFFKRQLLYLIFSLFQWHPHTLFSFSELNYNPFTDSKMILLFENTLPVYTKKRY